MSHVVVKPKAVKSLHRFHPWLFSGGIAEVKGYPQFGDTVRVVDKKGSFLGWGAWSPESQIRVRFWSFREDETVDREFFKARLQRCIQARQPLLDSGVTSAVRLIHAESDGFPGLIVDRYNDILVCQCLTAGIERWKPVLVELLQELCEPRAIYERSDVQVRKKEGLGLQTGLLAGEMPESEIWVHEHGIDYKIDVQHGHKTGTYLDQRDNRFLLQQASEGKEVLNCFSYTGGFGLAALKGGARSVLNIDASQAALNIARENIERNGFGERDVECQVGDVFKVLREFRDEGRKFDLIVLDPPKFVENKHHLQKGSRGYKDINLLGCRLLRPGGQLWTYSCSSLMTEPLFQKIVADAAVDARRDGQILRRLQQAQDHPTSLPFPEGTYLKGLVCRIW